MFGSEEDLIKQVNAIFGKVIQAPCIFVSLLIKKNGSTRGLRSIPSQNSMKYFMLTIFLKVINSVTGSPFSWTA